MTRLETLIGPRRARARRPPRLPVAFVAVLVLLALTSIVTGIVDVFAPVFVDGLETFGVLNALTERFGPGYMFVHILLHNLGLACLVPGVGLFAAKFEKSRRNRELAALILLVAVVLSLLTAVSYLVQAHDKFDEFVVIPLVAMEAGAVLLLAWRGYVVVRDFQPTPRIGWSLVHPVRELAPWFAISAAALAAGAFLETLVVVGFA